uniref:Reverse transcriptase N-terminal domain-containing protein n=1 Tax=Halimeda discoidea TaxID=118222 RepID=A0A1C9JB41_9CHLO|nr:hypothetical protein [Halimeda discoidea]
MLSKKIIISWKYSYQKLEKLQKKIKYKKNKRACRNLQRLLQKTSFIQLLVVKDCILSEKKCEKYNLLLQLWILCLLPIVNVHYSNSARAAAFAEIQYVFILKFENFFNEKNKYWLLSNILIEKKFFFIWLKRKNIGIEDTQFKRILENLSFRSNLNFIDYNGLIILPFKTFPKFKIIKSSIIKSPLLQIKFAKLYSIKEGLNLLYWRQNYKKELKRCLKINQPIDHIIETLKKKNLVSQRSPPLRGEQQLFYKIWHWLKKKHRNKSSKWLYQHYWQKSTSTKWIFSMENSNLSMYKPM